MKRISTALLLSLLLNGCGTYAYERAYERSHANTLEQQRDVLIKWTPPYTKSEFDGVRKELVDSCWEDKVFLRELINKCYSKESNNCAYDFYFNKLKEKKEEKCSQDPQCAKKQKVFYASRELNSTYYIVMARNPYEQAGLDMVIRRLCKDAGIGQRNGLPLNKMLNDVNQQEGLSPEIRSQFKQIVEACWVLSNNGIVDGTTTINTNY